MISSLWCGNFKGQTYKMDAIENKLLLLGPCGSGKTTLSEIIHLALLGYVPGGNKTAAVIFRDYSSGEEMVVGVEACGHKIERRWTREPKRGSVTMTGIIDGRTFKAPEVSSRVSDVANLAGLFDAPMFLGMTEQERLSYLFGLLALDRLDMETVDGEIEKLEKEILQSRANVRAAETTYAQLAASMDGIKAPAGTVPEVRSDIAKALAQIDELNEAAKILSGYDGREEERKLRLKEAVKELEGLPPSTPEPELAELQRRVSIGRESMPLERKTRAALDAAMRPKVSVLKPALEKLYEAIRGGICEGCLSFVDAAFRAAVITETAPGGAAKVTELRSLLDSLVQKVDAGTAAADALRDASIRDSKRATLLKAVEELSCPIGRPEMTGEEIDTRICAAQSAISKLREQEQALVKVQTLTVEAERLRLAKITAEEGLVRMKTALAEKRSARESALARSVGAIKEIGDGFLPDGEMEIRVDAGKLWAGWKREGRSPVRWDSLSGGESVTFSAAFGLAVLAKAGAPEKLLCVRGAELDDDMMREFLSGLSALDKSVQVIVETPHDPGEVEGFERLDLSVTLGGA